MVFFEIFRCDFCEKKLHRFFALFFGVIFGGVFWGDFFGSRVRATIFYAFLWGFFYLRVFTKIIGMKKRFLFCAVLTSLGLLSSCQKEEAELINITFGKLYDSSLAESIENHVETIKHSELSSLVSSKKEFILLIYDRNNTCTCYEEYEKTILSFIKKKNALIYGIAPTEFDGGHETFGLNISKNEETIAIFEDGEVKHQKTTSGDHDEFMKEENFSSWLTMRVHFSKMLYVNLDQFLALFNKGEQLTVGYLRGSCLDCSYVEDAVLSPFNRKDNNVSYVIDCDVDGIRLTNGQYDERQWNTFKEDFGLSSSGNEDYGYGLGYVPSFYTYGGQKAQTVSERIVDGAVYLNDKIEKNAETGDYYVADSFFTEERKPLLGFLGNSKVETAVIKGLKVPMEDVENGEWKKSAAAKYHNPLLEAYLTAYVGKK